MLAALHVSRRIGSEPTDLEVKVVEQDHVTWRVSRDMITSGILLPSIVRVQGLHRKQYTRASLRKALLFHHVYSKRGSTKGALRCAGARTSC